jgi:hypothetical protein
MQSHRGEEESQARADEWWDIGVETKHGDDLIVITAGMAA